MLTNCEVLDCCLTLQLREIKFELHDNLENLMEDSIHVTMNEHDQEVSWTMSFLKGLRDFCKEDEDRLKIMQSLIEEKGRIEKSAEHIVR